jgi:hypothetical protein
LLSGSQIWRLACALALLPPAVSAAQAPPTRDPAPGSIASRLASGGRYVIVTRRDLFPRSSQGNDLWFAITGYYVPANGTWTSEARGFPTPGTPWHACPPTTVCGGIHEAGFALDRWYRPEQHEIVAIGQRLTFDEQGRVFHQGRTIGYIVAPEFPDTYQLPAQ